MTKTMKCDACPIEFDVERFAAMVADDWGQQHTFQRPEFNGGQVIVCTGHFSPKQRWEPPADGDCGSTTCPGTAEAARTWCVAANRCGITNDRLTETDTEASR